MDSTWNKLSTFTKSQIDEKYNSTPFISCQLYSTLIFSPTSGETTGLIGRGGGDVVLAAGAEWGSIGGCHIGGLRDSSFPTITDLMNWIERG